MEARHVRVQEKGTRRLSQQYKRLLLPHMPIQFDNITSLKREKVESYIADKFYSNYQAEINSFLPYLLSTKTDDNLTAAMGFQPATYVQPLFLEQYLTDNIETTLSQVLHQSISRDQIAEVGNLTSSHRGTSQILFILTVAILHRAGFKWAVFTATNQVQRLLSKLGLSTEVLCEANPDLLIDKNQSWGAYYKDKPKVVVGDLTEAIKILEQHKVVGFMLKNYQRIINDCANKILINACNECEVGLNKK